MKIEFLYPELCNLFGDAMNAEYLRRAIPEAVFVKTPMKANPAFNSGEVNLIYLGSMTEGGQNLAAQELWPHRERFIDLINGGTVFLVTGNAFELFGTHIENEDGTFIETLGLFGMYAKRQMLRRYNSIYLGMFQDMEIVGFKSQFAHSYDGSKTGDGTTQGDGSVVFDSALRCRTQQNRPPVSFRPPVPALFQTLRGAGRKPGQVEDGVRINNFLATYVLGPLLVLNPLFARYLLELLGVPQRELPYEKAAMVSYEARLREFRDPKTGEEY